MTRAAQIIGIIAEELKLPREAHLDEVLACLYMIDKDGEIMKLLVEAGTKDIIERIKGE